MINFIKKFFSIIIIFILYCSILVACTKNQFKTIIIDDKVINKSNIDEDEDKDNFKIYQYNSIDSKDGTEEIEYLIGWYDNDNVVTVNNFNSKNIVLNKANYKYYFKNKIMDVNYTLEISPYNDNLAYITKDQLLKVYVKSLKTDENRLISEINASPQQVSKLRWSKNGRYLTFSVYLQDSYEVYIYDISKSELKKIPLLGYKSYTLPEIIISDDGKNVIAIVYEGKNKYGEDPFSIYLFSIDGQSFDQNKNKPLKSIAMPYVEFINSNKIIYMNSQNRSLNIYDMNLNKTLLVDDNVKNFKVSSDSSNIAYVRYLPKEGSNIYNCRINNDEVGVKQLLYKGFLPIDIQWSPDSKKILVTGGIYSDSSIKYEQIIRDINDKPKNLIFEFQ